MRVKVLLNFKRMSDHNNVGFCINIVGQMKGVSRYSKEQAQVKLVEKALADFQQARINASDGGNTL